MRPIPLDYAGPRQCTRRNPAPLLLTAALVTFAGLVAYPALSRPTCRNYSQTKARSDLRQLNIALHMYRSEHGRFPTQQEGFEALKPYFVQFERDPWDRPYVYHAPSPDSPVTPRFRILSVGRDGREGSPDDIIDGN